MRQSSGRAASISLEMMAGGLGQSANRPLSSSASASLREQAKLSCQAEAGWAEDEDGAGERRLDTPSA